MNSKNPHFVPENKLEELLINIHGDPVKQKEFSNELLKNDLIAFADETDMDLDENFKTKHDSTILIKDILYKDKIAVLVFTSLNWATSFVVQTKFMRPNEPYVKLNGAILLKSIIESPKKLDLIVLNAKSPYELHTTPQKIAQILKERGHHPRAK